MAADGQKIKHKNTNREPVVMIVFFNSWEYNSIVFKQTGVTLKLKLVIWAGVTNLFKTEGHFKGT